MNIEEYLLDRGRRQGIEVGRQEGRQETAQQMLITLLEQRFGSLSELALTRIQSSNVEMIEVWMKRVLRAVSVDEVLAA